MKVLLFYPVSYKKQLILYMTKIFLLTNSILLMFLPVLGQGNTLIKSNLMDFFMATTTFGIEQHIKQKISIELNIGYSYAEQFSIYDAQNLRGGVASVQLKKYFSKTKTNLSGIYLGFSTVHRFASYITDENSYMDTVYIYKPNIKASARYTSFGFIVGYQWEIIKGKLFWDNYAGMCGRIGSGYTRQNQDVSYYPIFELSYSGIAPKIGTALCIAIH